LQMTKNSANIIQNSSFEPLFDLKGGAQIFIAVENSAIGTMNCIVFIEGVDAGAVGAGGHDRGIFRFACGFADLVLLLPVVKKAKRVDKLRRVSFSERQGYRGSATTRKKK